MTEVVNICKECGVDFFTMDPERMLCHPCIRSARNVARNMKLKVFEVKVSPWQYFWRTFIILATDKKDAMQIGLELSRTVHPKFDTEVPQFQIEVEEIEGPFERGTLIYQNDFKFSGSSDYR